MLFIDDNQVLHDSIEFDNNDRQYMLLAYMLSKHFEYSNVIA